MVDIQPAFSIPTTAPHRNLESLATELLFISLLRAELARDEAYLILAATPVKTLKWRTAFSTLKSVVAPESNNRAAYRWATAHSSDKPEASSGPAQELKSEVASSRPTHAIRRSPNRSAVFNVFDT